MNCLWMRKSAGIVAWLVLLGVSISCAAPVPWMAPIAREELPVSADQPAIVDEPFYNFMKMSLTKAALETTPTSPSIGQIHPAEPSQLEPVAVEDPLYNFLKNILPQVPARNPESRVPSLAASHLVDPASRPAADGPHSVQTHAPADESFLDMGHPPKPRALGFPQITNTRENVVRQNNWTIL